jgi:medium-chain acyl-[acyl-carrier-protein] hydrolase
LLPLVRADSAITERYRYAEGMEPLACPITAFHGLRDDLIARRDVQAWQSYTTASFHEQTVDGDHAFIKTHGEHLAQTVGRALQA